MSMDERLEKALEFSNFMVTLNNQKRIFKEKFEQDIIYYHKGCQFTVNKELVCFCKIMMLQEQDSIVLIDDNSRPVEIEDLETFYNSILSVYHQASNEYLNKCNTLLKDRSINKMVEL
jgi:hypothetical protein